MFILFTPAGQKTLRRFNPRETEVPLCSHGRAVQRGTLHCQRDSTNESCGPRKPGNRRSGLDLTSEYLGFARITRGLGRLRKRPERVVDPALDILQRGFAEGNLLFDDL